MDCSRWLQMRLSLIAHRDRRRALYMVLLLGVYLIASSSDMLLERGRALRFPRSQPQLYGVAAGMDPIVIVDQIAEQRNAEEDDRIRQMEAEDRRRNERDGGMWNDDDGEEDPILARLAKRAAERSERNANGMTGMQEGRQGGNGEKVHVVQGRSQDGESKNEVNEEKQVKAGEKEVAEETAMSDGEKSNEQKVQSQKNEGISDLTPEELAKKLKEIQEIVKKNGVIDSAMVQELAVSELDRWKDGGVLFQNDTAPQDNTTSTLNLSQIANITNITAVLAKLGKTFADSPKIQQYYKKKIRVAMLSIPRKEKYVFETVTSLMLSTNYPLHLHMYIGVANREVKTFYEPFNHMPRVTIHPWDIPPGKYPYRVTKARGNYGRILMDFHRTIEEAKAANKKPPQGLLILEDDLRIGHDSMERLIQGIERIETFGIKEYVLDCYVVSFASLMITNIRGIMQRQGTPTCTQCMYFPAAVVPSLPKHLLDTRGPRKYIPYDLAIGEWLNVSSTTDKHKPWFSLRQSIVDHMGTKTTGLAGPNVKMHHARNFVP